jgi:ribulose-phosphate 3-epimerase
MIEITPAVMPESLDDLREKLSQIDGLVPFVQVDLMDGIFVPSIDWPYTPGGREELSRTIDEEEGLPFWNTLNYEIDLMVSTPKEAAEEWIRAGARRIILHLESADDIKGIVQRLSAELRGPTASQVAPIELGIALNIDTPNEALEPFLDSVDFVQFMGIEKIGYQGQPFDERVLSKVVDLRALRPDAILAVDGGVNLDTAPLLIEAGVNRLAVGSALFESEDLEETLKAFQSLG